MNNSTGSQTPPPSVLLPSDWAGYTAAVAAVAAATLVRLALDPVLGDNYPFSTYFAAVAVVAWWVRTRPSVAALVLSGVVSLYLFLPPRYSLDPTDPGALAGLGLFLAVGGVIVTMGHARRMALGRAERLLADAVVRGDELQRAAAAEAEQRERLRTTLAGIGDAVISTDSDGNVTYLNPVAESLTGWADAEAAGEPLTRVFHIVNEATRQPVENPAVRALNEGVVVGLANHTVLISKDGTERPIDDSAAPIRCKTGEVVGSVLVFRDITARRRAEEELHRSQERFRSTFEQAAVGIAHVGPDGRWLRVNGKLCDILGYGTNELTALTFQDVTHPDDLAADLADVRRLVAGEVATYSLEKRYIRRDRSLVWANLTVSLVRLPDGRPDYFISVVEDISARKDAEERLRTSEQQLRLYLEASAAGTWRWDADEGTSWDDRFHAMYGLPADGPRELDEWLGSIHPDDRARVQARVRAVLETPGDDDWREEFRAVHPAGERWMYGLGRGSRDAAGRLVRMSGLNLDVTDRKESERAIRAGEERLRTALTAARMVAWEWTSSDNRLLVSENAAEIFGLPAGVELTDIDQGLALVHPDDRAAYRTTLQMAMDARETYQTSYRLVRPNDGRTVWIEERGHAVTDRPGGAVRLSGVSADVTARREAEEAVREARSRLESTLAAGEIGTWEFDVARRVVRADRNLARMFGMTAGEGEERPLEQFIRVIHLDDRARVAEAIGRAVEAGDGYEADYRLAGPDGAVRWVLARGRVERDEAGRAVRMPGVVIDVTPQRRAEEAVRASEERRRLALDAAELGAWNVDPATGTLASDDRFRTLFRGDPAPLSYEEAFACIHPDDRQRVRDAVTAATRPDDPAPYAEEYRVVRPDGATRWVSAKGRATVVATAAGRRVASLDGTAADVTDRKRLQEDLRAGEEKYRALFESMDEGFCVIEFFDGPHGPLSDYVHVEANPAYTANAGIPDIVGQKVREMVPDEADGWVRTYRDVLVTGRPVRFERELVATGRHLDLAAFRIGPPDRRQVAVLFKDITERKIAENRLRTSEQRFRSLVMATTQMVWRTNAEGLADEDCPSWRGFTGETFEQMRGMGWVDAIPPDDRERTAAAWRRSVETASPFTAEYRVRRYDGEYRLVASRGVPVLTDGGGVREWIGAATDVTEERELAAQLREADRRKDEFLATLAHELRNPLAPLRNGLQVIRLAGAGGIIEQARTMMERQLAQMVRLVDDLLDISRVTSGKLELRRERVELRAIIDAALETSRPIIEQAGHTLTAAVPDEPIPVDGDTTRLAQVVSNLLNNSAKYTHRGGHIRLTARRDGGEAVVSVADNGIGIPPAMLDKVFVMFTQVDRTLEKTTGGLGVGLSLVNGLVEMHGGTVEARSAGEGLGSEFVVRLPVSAPGASDRSGGKAEDVVHSGHRRILVVDDNADAADSLGQLLELLGNQVRTAYDGEAGIRAAGEFRPAVVLCDIGMPKVNGHDVARRIRSAPWGKDMTLVALTGWGQDDDRQKSAQAGFDHHLVKPVEYAAMVKLLAGLEKSRG